MLFSLCDRCVGCWCTVPGDGAEDTSPPLLQLQALALVVARGDGGGVNYVAVLRYRSGVPSPGPRRSAVCAVLQQWVDLGGRGV